MSSRVFLVTGATAGIGLALARGCARVPHSEVILVGRNEAKCKHVRDVILAETSHASISYEVVDLSLYASVSAFTKRYVQSERPLHVLINNAGTCPKQKETTKEGLEMQWATNVMGYFWLTTGLLETLKRSAPSRVILLGSDYAGDLDLSDIDFKRRPYDNNTGSYSLTYRQSKQADRMLNVVWAKKWAEFNITVNCYHPGGIGSKLASDLGFQLSGSPEDGARTGLQLATSHEMDGVSGKYFVNGNSKEDPLARKEEENERLYKLCEVLTEKAAQAGN